MKRIRNEFHYKTANVDNDNTCVVCFKNARIESVGCCDHRVCFECSTRMRVLCERSECPICRQDNPIVIFTYRNFPFADYERKYRSMIFDKKFGIYFETVDIKKCFLRLLCHNCIKCEKNFDSLSSLNDHLQSKHYVSFCLLCIKYLKIFTSERSFYANHELKRHLISGDPDDTSHKGHPLCEFCNEHYMDNDELFRHLRRDHLYCYYCDIDGTTQFYGMRQALNEHMRIKHFVCDDEVCLREEFLLAFRTEYELISHKASQHARGHSRAEQRQIRSLNLDITFKRNNYAKEEHIFNPFNVIHEAENNINDCRSYSPINDEKKYELNENNFPSLDNNKKNNVRLNVVWDKRNYDFSNTNNNKLNKNDENNRKKTKQDAFPALCKTQLPINNAPVRWAPEPKKEPEPKKSENKMVSIPVLSKRNEFPELKPLGTKSNQQKLNNTNNIQQDIIPQTSNTKKKKKKKLSNEEKFFLPPNFEDRNKKLSDQLLYLFNISLVDEFRKKSQSYREGFVNVRTFYAICQELMTEKFMELFPELLVLLPDIRKQNELYEYHINEFGYDFRLQPCRVCKQILFRNEADFHQKYHDSSSTSLENRLNSLQI